MISSRSSSYSATNHWPSFGNTWLFRNGSTSAFHHTANPSKKACKSGRSVSSIQSAIGCSISTSVWITARNAVMTDGAIACHRSSNA